MKTVSQVLDGLRKVQGEQYNRQFNYQRQSDAYFGIDNQPSNTISDTTGRPIMRMQDLRSELRQRRGAPNFILPIVNDMVSLKGQLPLMRALPDDESPEAIELAQKRTYLIQDIWERSSMSVQQKKAAWYMSCLGDAIYTLDPVLPAESDELNPPGVYVTVWSPKLAYYKFKPGRWSQELSDLWLVWEMDAEDVEDEYGFTPRLDRVECIVHYDSKCKQTIIGDERVAAVEHGLDFVPAQWVRNLIADDQTGQADIAQAVDVHEEVQSLFLILGDAIVEAVYAPIKVRDAENVAGDTVEVGPRAVISVTATGDVTRVDPAPPPTAAQQLVQQMQDALFNVTGTTPVRVEGNMGGTGANVSGRMVHSVQQPQESRVNAWQAVAGYAYERLNQKAILMYQRIPELAKASLDIRGSFKGKAFALNTKGADIGGSARIEVKWDAFLGNTMHERLVMHLQAFSQGLIPGSLVVEQLGVDDPEGMIKKALIEKAMMQQSMAAMMPQGPQGGDPGQHQSDIMAPMQASIAGAAGGDPTKGSGGPGGPAGAAPSAPPVQPGPPQPSLPNFSPTSQAPGTQGMGPPPQTPHIMDMIREAMGSLPPDVQGDIVGLPAFESGSLVVLVKDAKHIPSGVIKRAFSGAGIPFPIKVKVAA